VGRHESPAPKARAFDILADFLAGVSADTTSAQTLAHAASAVAQAIGVEPTPAGPIVAYCLDAADSDGTALWCRCDGANRFEWRTAPRAAETPESAPASPQAVVELLSGSGDLKDWLDASDCEHQGLLFAGRWIGGVFVPSQRATPTPQQWAQSPYSTLLGAMGLALGIVQGQERARRLNEGLSHASRVLSEASQALSEAQTAGLIGQMAAGAAHELNNPLAVISGRAQLMRSRAKTPDEKKVWTTIVEQAQRISDILTELMSIASPPPPEPQVVAPRALLDHACKAFDEMRPSTAPAPKIEIAVGDAAPAAFVDPSQMEWAIGELIANAFTAGGDGVRVRLSAEDSGDEELLVTIEDDGPGMDDSTLERAFTPFFSSQPAGRRRGLGLTRVRRWVEINRGSVHVTSRPGAGTQVRLRLPTE